MPKPMTKTPSLLSLYMNALLKKTKRDFQVENPLPELTLTLEKQHINRKQLLQYNRVCGFSESDTVPASFLQVLSFPLQMALLTSPEMPIAAMGLVHVSNTINNLKPIDSKATLNITCSIGAQRLTAKGLSFDINAVISSNDVTVFTSTATLLYRCKTKLERTATSGEVSPLNSNHQCWALPGNIGRNYGKISRDLNPIHLFALSAKLFGFKRQIAHGLYLNAHSIAVLQGALPPTPFTVQTEFKRPAFIPSHVNFYSKTENRCKSIQIWSNDHKDLHLTATVSPITKEENA